MNLDEDLLRPVNIKIYLIKIIAFCGVAFLLPWFNTSAFFPYIPIYLSFFYVLIKEARFLSSSWSIL
jgi:hypothetical protein